MLARALDPESTHTPTIRKKSRKLYQEAVNRDLFAVPPADIAEAADSLYPLHPSAVSTLLSGHATLWPERTVDIQFPAITGTGELQAVHFTRLVITHQTGTELRWYSITCLPRFRTARVG